MKHFDPKFNRRVDMAANIVAVGIAIAVFFWGYFSNF